MEARRRRSGGRRHPSRPGLSEATSTKYTSALRLAGQVVWVSGLAVLLTELANGGAAFDHLATTPLVFAAKMPRPEYLQTATDPAFGTRLVRITDPGGKITSRAMCGAAYCTHRYSSAQAWNADQTLLVIANGC